MTALLELPEIHDRAVPDSLPSLSVDVVTDDRRGLQIWRSLEQQLGNVYLFCSADWVETWLQVFGHLPHRYLVGRAGSETVGIALLVDGEHREGPFKIRTLHLGTSGEPARDSVFIEYNRPLVDPDYSAPFADALWNHAQEDRRWDRLHFDGLAAEAAETLLAGRPMPSLRMAPCHYFDLKAVRDAGKDVLSTLGSSTRRNVKQNLKHLGELSFDWSETAAEAHRIFDDLISLHQARWTADGLPGCYSSEPFTRLHRLFIDQLVPQKRMVLTRVRRGSEAIGCVQLFVARNRLLFYQCGSSRIDNKLSPGLITDYLSMQAGLERGYDAYDFLAGDTVHKRKLSNARNEVTWATWSRPRLKLKALDLLRSLKRRLKSTPESRPAVSETSEDHSN